MELLIGALICCVLLGVVVWLLAEHPRTLLVALVFLLMVASCYKSEAAPVGCMLASALPPTQTSMAAGAAAFVPAGTFGGGAFDVVWVLALVVFVVLVTIVRHYEAGREKLAARVAELEALQAPPFATLDISSFEPTESENPFRRSITIEFTSLAGMVDFGHWLIEARRRLQRNGWPAK